MKKQEIEYKKLLGNDLYFNDYGILCGKYYVVLNTDDNEISSFYVVNIKEGGKAKKEFDFSISKNSYFNGIYDGKIYLTDINNRRQYVINPASEKIEETGTSKEAKYYDGEVLKNVDITTLTNEIMYFAAKKKDDKITEFYKDYNLVESYGNYYYKDNENRVYQIIGEYYEHKVLLFKFADFKELKVLNNNVFGVSGDTVYMYNNAIGLRKVAANRELQYNYKNIYDIYYD